jgi:hypothetical protein
MYAESRPRLTIAAPLLRSRGELHIVCDHDILSFPDPDGAVQRLVRLADGSRSTAELHAVLAREFPQLDEQDVVEIVTELEAVGILEDCAPRRRIRGDRDGRELAAPSYY